jgi:hypothetical protein
MMDGRGDKQGRIELHRIKRSRERSEIWREEGAAVLAVAALPVREHMKLHVDFLIRRFLFV